MLTSKLTMTPRLKKLMSGKLSKEFRDDIRKTIEDLAQDTENRVRHYLSIGPKDMPKYKGKSKARAERVRLPKNPTDYLRIRSGTLIGSIRSKVVGKGINTIAQIGVGVKKALKYAAVHELGLTIKAWGKYPVKMKKRPFLLPALKDMKPIVRKRIKSVIRRTVIE